GRPEAAKGLAGGVAAGGAGGGEGTGCAGLLAGARAAVQRTARDRLVDRAHQLAVRRRGAVRLAALHLCLQAAEVRLDGRRVQTVLQTLALGAEDALLL